jgi:hypothetical protein
MQSIRVMWGIITLYGSNFSQLKNKGREEELQQFLINGYI